MDAQRHWAKIEEKTFVWGIKFLFRVYSIFGRWILQLFLYPIVSYYWLINHSARNASRNYLAKVSAINPALELVGSYSHFMNFANSIIDKLEAWSGALTLEDIEFHGREELLAELETGRGVLLLGSHLGNLDVCRLVAYLDKKVTINVLVHTHHAEKFNQLLNQYDSKSQLNLIQVTEITPATAMLLCDKVDNGELVIVTADRVSVTHPENAIWAKFLEANALFPAGAFILASLLKCPVYTVFCLKHQQKYAIYFDYFSQQLNFPRFSRKQAIQETIQQYALVLERYCLKEPLQWFNFFNFFEGD
jgi:predicted LPLAT superfamily acyltransferase